MKSKDAWLLIGETYSGSSLLLEILLFFLLLCQVLFSVLVNRYGESEADNG